jgi:hypothetical protein
MTITRGAPWGENGPLPEDGVVVSTDIAASRLVEAARARGEVPPAIGLLGGDLCRTLGGRGSEARLRSPDGTRATVDVIVALDDEPERCAIAHVAVHRHGWLFGPITLAMNAAWLGAWNVAPRAHPNDGQLDLVRADLSVGDRLKARRRLLLGTHIPHPAIRMARHADATVVLPRAVPVWIDGERAGTARRVALHVVPDALRVAV